MQTRHNSLKPLHLYGTIEKVDGCKGPFLALDRGMDTVCCARCQVLRNMIYRKHGTALTNDPEAAIPFFDYMKEMTNELSEIKTSYIISECGRKVMMVMPFDSELVYDSIRTFLQKQFLVRKRLMVISKKITPTSIGMTRLGLPVILPDEDMIKLSSYGGDEGVDTSMAGKIKVTDISKASKSGKWMYIINYYEMCKMIFGEEEVSDIRNGYMNIF